MSIPQQLDHIVIAGPDLDGVIAWFAERTGVTAVRGGTHPTGTANALVAFTVDGQRGPHYLELIGPDPERVDRSLPTKFGIDRLDHPSVRAYAVHPDDIDATVAHARDHGEDPGDVGALSRRTPEGELLEWRLTFGSDSDTPLPFLIDWGSTPQPGLGALPTVELVAFVRVDPDPDAVTARLATLGLGNGVAEVIVGPQPGYRLIVRDAGGHEIQL